MKKDEAFATTTKATPKIHTSTAISQDQRRSRTPCYEFTLEHECFICSAWLGRGNIPQAGACSRSYFCTGSGSTDLSTSPCPTQPLSLFQEGLHTCTKSAANTMMAPAHAREQCSCQLHLKPPPEGANRFFHQSVGYSQLAKDSPSSHGDVLGGKPTRQLMEI